MAILIIASQDRPDWWARELRTHAPELDIRIWPEVGDVDDVEYVLAWKPPRGALACLPNLAVVFSLGAGVDHLFADPEFPAHVAVVRVIDPYLTAGMREYVVLHTLHYHKNQPALDRQQRDHVWDDRARELRQADEQGVGILGLGELGRSCAEALTRLEFDVAGWSRTPKDLPGVTCFEGRGGLDALLARSRILICLLPLTTETEGILDTELFSKLPNGSYLINAARGGHLVEEDLIPALDDGRLTHVTLDVFRTEPLPADHPFWDHPQITVTPHNAAITDPRSIVIQILADIERHTSGAALSNRVDIGLGY
ncbi:MAG: glyoxylate/hydroxypyruvate reductase A [Alphaproteobacteria bacterium]|nr:glyoxylate/hydroxypyruvate reductase A [Alphaproteobacteria bacterium]HCP01654.1 glyoxylate/hydroxypyruvate reductase A [Rhodospirillaceae bacterium]